MKALICPLCSLHLIENVTGVACSNRHQFDKAKEGYFNLLPVHYKNSRDPGDSKQQLVARRAFLTAGYFSPLVSQLKTLINVNINNLVDIGCGEGYFTRFLGEHCYNAAVYGVDISKEGIRLAAKGRSAKETYLVASSYALPIADTSVDLVLRIYAPSKDEELFRILKPGGQLIIVTPGEDHLIGLRERIYDTIKPHPKPKVVQGFTELALHSVSFPLDVPHGDLTESLLRMTPFSWKLTEELLESLVNTGIKDQAHFQISVYERARGSI
ncbi:MAG: methyltransferase domain-containing protein [Gammaproteobacteria bacterium]|nr:MAG: methyltransferase domain-containing protein [Gammaproteobacteria bacterium]